MEIKKNRRTSLLFLSQENYLKKMLFTYGMIDSNLVQTSLGSYFRLKSSVCPIVDEEKHEMVRVPYKSTVRCLMYAMVLTRPDIAPAVK